MCRVEHEYDILCCILMNNGVIIIEGKKNYCRPLCDVFRGKYLKIKTFFDKKSEMENDIWRFMFISIIKEYSKLFFFK